MFCFQFIVIEADACSVEEAAVTAAQAAYDEALENVSEKEEEAADVATRIIHPVKGSVVDLNRARTYALHW